MTRGWATWPAGSSLPCVADGNHHIYHQYTAARPRRAARRAAEAPGGARGAVRGLLPAVAAPPGGLRCTWATRRATCRSSERATREVLSLPVHPDLTEEQVEYAADCVRAFFG